MNSSSEIGDGSRHTISMRVLVVEDDVALSRAIRDELVADGYEVDVVHNGDDALWRAREGEYGLIILDIMIPGPNGYEVCRTLRAEANHTPILMLTAKDGDLDQAEGFELGADDWITKPFSPVVLLARMKALSRRASGPQREVFRVGDLSIDPRQGSCGRGGVSIALTRREFALLEVLMRADGQTVRKEVLLRAVWGIDHSGDPNIVESYIRHLRRKVDHPFDPAVIETVRGVGYRIVQATNR